MSVEEERRFDVLRTLDELLGHVAAAKRDAAAVGVTAAARALGEAELQVRQASRLVANARPTTAL